MGRLSTEMRGGLRVRCCTPSTMTHVVRVRPAGSAPNSSKNPRDTAVCGSSVTTGATNLSWFGMRTSCTVLISTAP